VSGARGLSLLFACALAACSPAEPPASVTAPPPPAAPSAFIPDALTLERFLEQGSEPTLRRIAAADYWLHYRLMQATGMEETLGGEAQAINALKALGEAYERRARGASTEIPRMIPAQFTGEGMSSGLLGMSMGTMVSMVTGSLVSGLSDAQLSAMIEAGPTKRSSDQGSFELHVGQDGSMTQTTEFEVNQGGINGKVKMTSRMDTCPDENGRVTVDVEVNSQMSVSGKPGTGGFVHTQMKYERYLDDDAHLISGDDGGASNMRVRMGGHENFQSQSVDITVGHERGGKPIRDVHEEQGFSMFRMDEAQRTMELLQSVELQQTLTAEAMLRGLPGGEAPWESGRCIDLEVSSSPAKRTAVRPGTAFDLEASPRVKSDGSSAGGTVTATLSGRARLQPGSGKVRADARYGYAAPEKKEEKASIAFEARSRRGVGRATLDFDTMTSRSYRAHGTTDGATFAGEICSLDQPFVVNVDAITGKWPMEFTPQDGVSGQMRGSYSSDGCTLAGGGPYSATLNDDGSGKLRFTYNSTATCEFGSTTTSRTTELTLVPASDLRCD
jgi:hypothetical protein